MSDVITIFLRTGHDTELQEKSAKTFFGSGHICC